MTSHHVGRFASRRLDAAQVVSKDGAACLDAVVHVPGLGTSSPTPVRRSGCPCCGTYPVLFSARVSGMMSTNSRRDTPTRAKVPIGQKPSVRTVRFAFLLIPHRFPPLGHYGLDLEENDGL